MTQSYGSSAMTSAGGCYSNSNVRRCQLTNVRTKVRNLLFWSTGKMMSSCSSFTSHSTDYLLTSGWWEKLIHQPVKYFNSIWCKFMPWSVVDWGCLRVRGEKKGGHHIHVGGTRAQKYIYSEERGLHCVFFTGRATWRAIYHDLSTMGGIQESPLRFFSEHGGTVSRKDQDFKILPKSFPQLSLAIEKRKWFNASTYFLLCAKLQSH